MMSTSSSYKSAFDRALVLADIAARMDEVPVGAVVFERTSGKIITEAHNEVERLKDATAHAELLAIRRACEALGTKNLSGYDLAVTLEPCAMCASAIAHARIGRVVFGAYDSKSGGVEHGARVFSHATCHHKPEIIGGVREAECTKLISDFFRDKRGQEK
jgi:tRNA(Arg) A34 adenosine deaminase TadA